jgi:hypothetical protein
MEERKTLIMNPKLRTIGVSQTGISFSALRCGGAIL